MLEVGGLTETVVVEGASASDPDAVVAAASTTLNDEPDRQPAARLAQHARLRARSCRACRRRAAAATRSSTACRRARSTSRVDGVSVQDNHLKTTDGFFARMSPRLDAVEEVTVTTAGNGADAIGAGRDADPVHDALGQQPVHGQRLLLLPERHAQHEHLLQQGARPAEERRDAVPAGRPRRRSDRDPGRLRRPRQGVLLRQLRREPHAADHRHGQSTS